MGHFRGTTRVSTRLERSNTPGSRSGALVSPDFSLSISRGCRNAAALCSSHDNDTTISPPRTRYRRPMALANGPAAPTACSQTADCLSPFRDHDTTIPLHDSSTGALRLPQQNSGVLGCLRSASDSARLQQPLPLSRSRFSHTATLQPRRVRAYGTELFLGTYVRSLGDTRCLRHSGAPGLSPTATCAPSALPFAILRRRAGGFLRPGTERLGAICMHDLSATQPLEVARGPQLLGGPQDLLSRLRAFGTTQPHQDDLYDTLRI